MEGSTTEFGTSTFGGVVCLPGLSFETIIILGLAAARSGQVAELKAVYKINGETLLHRLPKLRELPSLPQYQLKNVWSFLGLQKMCQ
jgi:hypothetical protein